MAFTDWIKNRNKAPSQPPNENAQSQKPETAKQMYTRSDAEAKANRIPPTPDQEARAQKIGEELNKATKHQQQSVPARSPAPDEGSSNAAQLQNQNQQDKTQAALSPTDDAKGKTAMQENKPAPEKTTERAQQTIARRPPSWER